MGPVSRKTAGWEVRLHEQIEAAKGRPFSWGAHDCCTWAFDVAAALTDQPSHAGKWRGKYKTAAGAEKVQRRLGYQTRHAGCTDLLGPALPGPLLAQRGDLVLGLDQAVGVCFGASCAFVAPDGLESLPLASCLAAWRV